MEMAKGVTCCLFALLLTLTSVSGIQRLNRMRDLKRIMSDDSVPEHSLVLLYWFAHTVFIDCDDQIRPTFNPANGDFGSHPYNNHENLLGRLHRGQQYYTIGNIYEETSIPLPYYVINPPADIEAGNMDRIIIRVRGRVIEEVYLTQHSEELGTSYDPDYTYQITTNLLRQIQEFPMGANYQTLVSLRGRYGNNADVSHISDSIGELACLGLFLCIVLKHPMSFKKQTTRPTNRNNREPTENWNNHEKTAHVLSLTESQNNVCCTTRRKCILAVVLTVLIIIVVIVIYLTV